MFLKNVFDKNSSVKYATDCQELTIASKNDIRTINNLSSKKTPYGSHELYEILSINNSNKYSSINRYDLSKKNNLESEIRIKDLARCENYYSDSKDLINVKVDLASYYRVIEENRVRRYKQVMQGDTDYYISYCNIEFGEYKKYINSYLPDVVKRKGRKRPYGTKKPNEINYKDYLDNETNKVESIDALNEIKYYENKKYNRRLESIRIDVNNDNVINLCQIDGYTKRITPCTHSRKFNRINKAAMIGII